MELLELLKTGRIKEFNDGRQQYPIPPAPNFPYLNISDIDLTEVNLSQADLMSTNFSIYRSSQTSPVVGAPLYQEIQLRSIPSRVWAQYCKRFHEGEIDTR